MKAPSADKKFPFGKGRTQKKQTSVPLDCWCGWELWKPKSGGLCAEALGKPRNYPLAETAGTVSDATRFFVRLGAYGIFALCAGCIVGTWEIPTVLFSPQWVFTVVTEIQTPTNSAG